MKTWVEAAWGNRAGYSRLVISIGVNSGILAVTIELYNLSVRLRRC
jgi:hypothetical protein